MLNTLKIFEELSPAMGPEAAHKLADVLGALYEELRNAVTKADFAELRAVVHELAEAQKRTEERLGRLEAAVAELAEAQQRTEQRVNELVEAQQRTEARLDRLEATVARLAEAQERTEQRVNELVEAQQRTEQRLSRLAEALEHTNNVLADLIHWVRKHEDRLGKLDGRTLEMEFRDKASAYLGTVLRRTRVIPAGDLGDELEDVLTPEEWADLLRADVILRGRALLGEERQEVYAVVEVSVTLDEGDVARASRRAGLMRKKGWKVLAVAAGTETTPELITTANQLGVAVLQDGQQFNWPQALAAA